MTLIVTFDSFTTMKTILPLLTAFLGVLVVSFPVNSHSQVIVSMQVNTFPDHNLLATDVAGVIPAANYNIAGPGTGYTQDSPAAATLSGSNLLTSTGATSNIGFTLNYDAGSGAGNNANTPYNKLMNNMLISKQSGALTLGITGLSASDTYDLIVYINSPFFASGSTATITLNGGSALSVTTNNALTSFTQITGANAVGNYVEYDGLTGATAENLSITQGFAGITGFQVVDTPEPATIGLIAAGVMGLAVQLGRKRRLLA